MRWTSLTFVAGVAGVATLALAACATSQEAPRDADPGDPDAAPAVDGRAIDAPGAADAASDAAPDPDAPPAPDAGVLPYRRTIAIDGTDDFTTDETIATTSAPGYVGHLGWDDANLYIGYRGADLDPAATDAATKWLFVYLDVDPGPATGAVTTPSYNTQHATLPVGFGAEYYFRWKCDGSFTSLEVFQGTGWVTATTPVAVARGGDFLELAVPRSLFTGAPVVGVATWMINEKDGVEASYAGLYPGSFTDGYAANLVVTRYLAADFTSPLAPADPARSAP